HSQGRSAAAWSECSATRVFRTQRLASEPAHEDSKLRLFPALAALTGELWPAFESCSTSIRLMYCTRMDTRPTSMEEWLLGVVDWGWWRRVIIGRIPHGVCERTRRLIDWSFEPSIELSWSRTRWAQS